MVYHILPDNRDQESVAGSQESGRNCWPEHCPLLVQEWQQVHGDPYKRFGAARQKFLRRAKAP
jgi:hypothetical protein